ncbi:hypothetical protein ACOSP7_003149 [Xanthoceras sorbifolium]
MLGLAKFSEKQISVQYSESRLLLISVHYFQEIDPDRISFQKVYYQKNILSEKYFIRRVLSENYIIISKVLSEKLSEKYFQYSFMRKILIYYFSISVFRKD